VTVALDIQTRSRALNLRAALGLLGDGMPKVAVGRWGSTVRAMLPLKNGFTLKV
jgi:hypothetical protein